MKAFKYIVCVYTLYTHNLIVLLVNELCEKFKAFSLCALLDIHWSFYSSKHVKKLFSRRTVTSILRLVDKVRCWQLLMVI